MPPKNRRAGVPEAEWERYKEDIKNLYLIDDLTLKAVADEMRGRLDASPAQFESHLKAWGIRKNLAAQEWKLIFDAIDKLPRNTDTKIIISGHAAPATKIQRAKRKYQNSPPGDSKRRRLHNDFSDDEVQAISDIKDVVVQIQVNGIWTALPAARHNGSIEIYQNRDSHHTLNASNTTSNHNEQLMMGIQHDADILPQIEISANSELSGTITLNCGLESRSLEVEETVACANDDIAQGNTAIFITASDYHNGAMIASPHAGNSNYIMNATLPSIGSTIEELVTSMENVAELSLSDPMNSSGLELSVQETNNSSLEWEQCAFRSTDATATGVPISYGTPHQFMGDAELQFQLIETDIPSDMFSTTTQLRTAYCHSPISLNASSMVLPSTEIIGQVIEVCRNVLTPDPSLPWHLCTYIHAKHKSTTASSTPALVNLFSARVFVGERQSQFEKLPSNIVFEARIHTRLLVAMINRLPGLKKVSSAGLLKFLQRHQAIQVLMASLLRSCSKPTAMSLAENIFQAALEADDVVIVENLLDHTTFIDLKKTVYYHEGERYTPVEMAARYQSLEVLEHPLNRDVDINMPYNRYLRRIALHILIRNNTAKQSTLSDRFLSLVNILLTNNTVSMSCVRDVLKIYTDPRLAIILIEKSASETPLELVSDNDLLRDIVIHLQEQDTTNLIMHVVKHCQKSGDSRCSYGFLTHVRGIGREAIQRGYKKLVEILLPHIESSNKVFQNPEKPRNNAMSNLTPPNYTGLNKEMDIVEDFIVALQTKNQDLLHSLEAKGVLNSLKGRCIFRLGAVLDIAVTTGNSEYATKIHSALVSILDIFGGYNFYHTIKAALSHDFDYIAEDLLAMVACSSEHVKLLSVAIQRRKPGFVKNILEYGVDPNKFYDVNRWIVLEAAIECGDSSIFNDVWQAHSQPIYPTESLLTVALQKGSPDLFWDILAPAKFTPTWAPPDPNADTWSTAALSVAIKHEDLPLLDKLFHFGVKLGDDNLLLDTMEEHPSMVEPLLERYQKAYPDGIPGYGRSAIRKAVLNCPKSSHWLAMFLRFKLITQQIPQGDRIKDMNTLFYLAYQDSRTKPPSASLVQMYLDSHCPVDINGTMDDKNFRYGGCYAKKTILLEAIGRENTDLVELLIRHHANINEPALYGVKRTPLQRAAEQDHHELVSLLLSNGADPNAEPATFDGATALQFAAINGNIEIAEILMENGARLDVPPPRGSSGRWPLMGAAEHGRLDMIQFLWEVNGHPFSDQICIKAMRLAERKGHFGCKLLVEQLMIAPSSTDISTLGT